MEYHYVPSAVIQSKFSIAENSMAAIGQHQSLIQGIHYILTPGGHRRYCLELFWDWWVNGEWGFNDPMAHQKAIARFQESLPSYSKKKPRELVRQTIPA